MSTFTVAKPALSSWDAQIQPPPPPHLVQTTYICRLDNVVRAKHYGTGGGGGVVEGCMCLMLATPLMTDIEYHQHTLLHRM